MAEEVTLALSELPVTPTRRPRTGRMLFEKNVLFPKNRNRQPDSVPRSATEWSTEEHKSLIEFLLLHGDPHKWPTHSRQSRFWIAASEFVKQRSNSSIQRSGMTL